MQKGGKGKRRRKGGGGWRSGSALRACSPTYLALITDLF